MNKDYVKWDASNTSPVDFLSLIFENLELVQKSCRYPRWNKHTNLIYIIVL